MFLAYRQVKSQKMFKRQLKWSNRAEIAQILKLNLEHMR